MLTKYPRYVIATLKIFPRTNGCTLLCAFRKHYIGKIAGEADYNAWVYFVPYRNSTSGPSFRRSDPVTEVPVPVRHKLTATRIRDLYVRGTTVLDTVWNSLRCRKEFLICLRTAMKQSISSGTFVFFFVFHSFFSFHIFLFFPLTRLAFAFIYK